MTRTRDWDIDTLVTKFDPRVSCRNSSVNLKDRAVEAEVSYQDIKDAYLLAAMIVAEHGEEYLPIFERLQTELNSFSAKKKLVDKAKEIASNYQHLTPV